ncbi:MAG: isocitrate/isopropylmalate dehydrogenase family protein [Planctomycetaceae bacterium]
MKAPRIAVIPGDGIGPEVTTAAQRATELVLAQEGVVPAWTEFAWGSDHYFSTGRMAPPDYLDTLAGFDAILLGAVGHPQIQDHVTLNGLLLPIRRRFDQFVCLRPARLYAGVPSPLKDKPAGSIDLVVYRENTEGEYANIGGRLYSGFPEESAIQTSVFTRRGCERIIREAFQAADLRPRRRLASITKSNAQGFGMVLWDECFDRVAAEFPRVQTESLLIDRAVMEFVRRPESFDVVVASNLFGDILTDLAAIVVGSMGLAASGNIDPTRRGPSMFEPVHGSAPDIAGRGIANPLAAILSAAMMLEHLRFPAAAATLHAAVATVLEQRGPKTPDLGGQATTTEVAEAVYAALASRTGSGRRPTAP